VHGALLGAPSLKTMPLLRFHRAGDGVKQISLASPSARCRNPTAQVGRVRVEDPTVHSAPVVSRASFAPWGLRGGRAR